MISLLGELRRAFSFQSTDVMTVQNTFSTCGKKHYQITPFLDLASFLQTITYIPRLQIGLILADRHMERNCFNSDSVQGEISKFANMLEYT